MTMTTIRIRVGLCSGQVFLAKL